MNALRSAAPGLPVRRVAKAALLGASLGWLLWLGVEAARRAFAPEAMLGYVMLLAGYALLGALSYGGARLRTVAAAGAVALVVAVAFATFSHLLLVLGGLGVAAACLIPAGRP